LIAQRELLAQEYGDITFVTADQDLLDAARAAGLNAEDPGDHVS
jgi:hypothetical protein